MGILIFDNIMFIDLTSYNRESEFCYENSFAFSNILFQHNFEAGKEGRISERKNLEIRAVRFTFEPSHVFFFKQPGMNRYFDRAIFTIFATNVSFLRVMAKLQIQLSKISNIYHVIVPFLPKKHCIICIL